MSAVPHPLNKWFSTVRAVCALHGIELHLLEGETRLEFIVTHEPFTQSAATQSHLIALLQDLGVELPEPSGEGPT